MITHRFLCHCTWKASVRGHFKYNINTNYTGTLPTSQTTDYKIKANKLDDKSFQ